LIVKGSGFAGLEEELKVMANDDQTTKRSKESRQTKYLGIYSNISHYIYWYFHITFPTP